MNSEQRDTLQSWCGPVMVLLPMPQYELQIELLRKATHLCRESTKWFSPNSAMQTLNKRVLAGYMKLFGVPHFAPGP